MNFIWLIANKFGYELFREALRIVKIDAVITLSEDSTTRMYDFDEITKKRLSLNAHMHDISLIEIVHIKDEVERIKNLKPDYIIVAGWRQIIPQEILDIPKYGVIGFHPTLLPIGRGPAPIINSILLNVKMSGATMFFYNDKIDSGDIISYRHFYIEPTDYAKDVYDKYINAGIKLIKFYLPMLEEGELSRRQQYEKEATYFPKRTIEDNEITLSDSLEDIDRKVRAFSEPYLGAFIKRDGKKLIIERCRIEED